MTGGERPVNHHFLPKFLLKEWAGSDGRVTVFRRQHGGRRWRSFFPAGIGYGEDLWTLKGTRPGGPDPHHIERRVFEPLDTRAAKVRVKLAEKGAASLTDLDRATWAEFLLSLRVRRPAFVENARQIARAKFRVDAPAAGDPVHRKAVQQIEAEFPGFVENFGIAFLPELLKDPRATSRLLDLDWCVLDLGRSPHTLLLSDNTSIVLDPVFGEQAIWAVPISPRHIFFAFASRADRDLIVGQHPRAVVRACNGQVVVQADDRVFARGASQQRYIVKTWAGAKPRA